MSYPLWATPARRDYLVHLFEQSGGFCIYGHRPCPHSEHHFENFIEGLIGDWKADDREERSAWLQLERRVLHLCPDERGWGRRFDPVERERFFENRPPYYLEGIGISGLTFHPVAKVRVPSGYTRLYVDVAKSKELSKNQRRKAKRYGLPIEQVQTIEDLCEAAVDHFWKVV